ncbi:hypothetical protein PUN28_019917 [Cardiocondyla obscurior]|uniref:Ribosomal protein S10 n=1 Tax=Cardiocondyla obscurior TaxID=286306 RepID=A0AAW2EAW0_9HYME
MKLTSFADACLPRAAVFVLPRYGSTIAEYRDAESEKRQGFFFFFFFTLNKTETCRWLFRKIRFALSQNRSYCDRDILQLAKFLDLAQPVREDLEITFSLVKPPVRGTELDIVIPPA